MKTQNKRKIVLGNQTQNSVENSILMIMKLYSSEIKFMFPWAQDENSNLANNKGAEKKIRLNH